MLEFSNVSKKYENGVNALYNVTFRIEQGEFVYIIGPTGSGKSTILRLINGETVPTTGTVHLDEIDVGALKRSQLPRYRQNLGVVFQENRLLPEKTVFENVYFALEVINMDKIKARQRVREVLNLVGLDDKADSFPRNLSGGQAQRCNIARAIANTPRLLVCDEPTGNLDPMMSREIVQLLAKINKEENTTILMVTHDDNIVNTFRKRTLVIENGYITLDSIEGGYRHHE